MSLSSTPAHSAVKAGSVCKKVGIESVVGSKTFTCIKSGKKLVWNKGSIKPENSPTADTAPKWVRSYSEISSTSRKIGSLLTLGNIEISQNVDSRLVEKLLSYQNIVSSYWKYYGFESKYPLRVLVLSEKDYQIYLKHAAERKFDCSSVCNESNWFSPNFSSKFQGTVLIDNWLENVYGQSSPTGLTILYVIGTQMVNKNLNWAPDLATAFTHEYGHAIQFSYLEGWRNFGQMACWNNEGFPAFFEDAFYFENYSEKFKISFLNPPNGTYLEWLKGRVLGRENGFRIISKSVFNTLKIDYTKSDEAWIEFFKYTDTRNSKGCEETGYGRNHGSIISRLYYEDFGPKAFLDILKNTNDLKSWTKAFFVTTGKEYDVWLKERVIPEFKKI